MVIAKDARKSSIILIKAFKKGLIDSGRQVYELEGVSSSPLLYFANDYLQSEGAVMVTGSHNSLECNGFKFMRAGKPFYGDDLKSILCLLNNLTPDENLCVNSVIEAPCNNKPYNPLITDSGYINDTFNSKVRSHELIDLRAEYLNSLLKNISLSCQLKIAWECNNSGVAHILKHLPGENLLLNVNTDGVFRHSPPDPLIEKTLEPLKDLIIKQVCNLGFAFDGDGDRLVLVKSDGKALTSDQLIYLLALSLKSQPNRKIIVDVKSSQILIEALEQEGFTVIMAPGGHSIMKTKIVEENAVLAGEASGHFIINDNKYHPFDDSLYVALRLIEYLQNHPIVELTLPNFYKEFKIPINRQDKLKIIEKIQIGGMRKNYSLSWWLIRASNTEDYILVKYEAESWEMVVLIEKELLEVFQDISLYLANNLSILLEN